MEKKKETKELGKKWDGRSRPSTNLYKRNYDEIFKKGSVHKSKRSRSGDSSSGGSGEQSASD